MRTATSRRGLGGWLVADSLGVALATLIGLSISMDAWQVLGVIAFGGIVAVMILRGLDDAVLAYSASRPVAASLVYVSIAGVSVGQAWTVGLAGLCALYLMAVVLRGEDTARVHFPAPLVALGVSYGVLGVLRGEGLIGPTYWLRYVSWALLLISVAAIAYEAGGARRAMSAGQTLSVLTIAAIVVAMGMGQYGEAYYSYSFTQSLNQGPHALASMAVLCLPFALWAYLHAERRRWWWLLVSLGLSAGVLLSLVRTTTLALIPIWVTYAYVAKGRSSRSFLASVGAVALFGLLAFPVLWPGVATRFADVVGLLQGSGSTWTAGSGRLAIWGAVIGAVSESPSHLLFGSGAGASFDAVSKSLGQSLWAHNDFLELLVSGGVLTAGAFVLMLAWATRMCIRVVRRRSSSIEAHDAALLALGGLGAYLVMSVFNGILFQAAAIPLAVLLGVITAHDRRESRSRANTVCSFEGQQPPILGDV